MQNKYKDISFGTAEAVFNKLGGKEGIEKFLRDETKVVEVEVTEFPEFMTIKIGTHDSVDELRQSLKDKGNRISSYGNDILGKIALAETETEVTLHSATVKELTGKDVASNREINEAIRSKGYDLCPAEVGPQLRLQYSDQPSGEYLRVAMEPIADSDGDLFIFDVNHAYDDRWLDSDGGHPDDRWNGDNRFVFVSRK